MHGLEQIGAPDAIGACTVTSGDGGLRGSEWRRRWMRWRCSRGYARQTEVPDVLPASRSPEFVVETWLLDLTCGRPSKRAR